MLRELIRNKFRLVRKIDKNNSHLITRIHRTKQFQEGNMSNLKEIIPLEIARTAIRLDNSMINLIRNTKHQEIRELMLITQCMQVI